MSRSSTLTCGRGSAMPSITSSRTARSGACAATVQTAAKGTAPSAPPRRRLPRGPARWRSKSTSERPMRTRRRSRSRLRSGRPKAGEPRHRSPRSRSPSTKRFPSGRMMMRMRMRMSSTKKGPCLIGIGSRIPSSNGILHRRSLSAAATPRPSPAKGAGRTTRAVMAKARSRAPLPSPGGRMRLSRRSRRSSAACRSRLTTVFTR
mmetsp:Transcript_31492/g.104367  ORF Transcript_31492/g.104367 Transcript_31492/m.104367 type:complete len:205 (-) Transcript_31492:1557-2171(-)